MTFKDHFSKHAAIYRDYRPGYPDALFDWLLSHSPGNDHCWDCATGNGQAAEVLATRFMRVSATDASADQIAAATPCRNIAYSVASAERSELEDASTDLITVAQALHWFDVDAFFAEAHRVLKPGGLLAVWTYTAQDMEGKVGEVVRRVHQDIVGDYWPAERAFVDSGYAGLPFPYAELASPVYWIEVRWTLAQLMGYLVSWSATQRYMTERGEDPIAQVVDELRSIWDDPASLRLLRWPIKLRAGNKPR